jgi:hypothetical protein
VSIRDYQVAEIDPLTFFTGTNVRVTGRVRHRQGLFEVVVHEADLVSWDGKGD